MELQWPLIAFTVFVCLSAGTLSFTALAGMRRDCARIQMPGIVVAFAAIVIGGIASALHLQTPMNYFGQFGNPSSGINQELVCVALAAIAMIAYFVQLKKKGEAGTVLKVASIVVSAVLVIVMAHSYLMAAIPVWNTLLLPAYYLANAAALGGVTVVLVGTALHLDEGSLKRLGLYALAAVCALALVAVAYAVFICALGGGSFTEVLHTDVTTVPPTDPAAIGARMLGGDLALLFWGAVVAVGLALPLAVLALRRERLAVAPLAVALGLLLVGSVAFRMLLYCAGGTFMTY
ncbi:hypothetical protein H8S61_03240 [Eggerthella sp. NSJ-70]|uniref:DMSO reductase n=1 Tax=Eggerthella hominis TaxID=2763043 RepID=A0ABR7BNN6_9ACTN|nr:DmsC/YnfH family molybdoenzyme membrane anchor subunit [Eggerthella hominis]MBC5583212.1 hypothetical protein [Eggerthella hominis]